MILASGLVTGSERANASRLAKQRQVFWMPSCKNLMKLLRLNQQQIFVGALSAKTTRR